jgi:hypothetical protein
MRLELDAEALDLLDRAKRNVDRGISAYPGMTYEEGIIAAFEYIQGECMVAEILPAD